MIPPSNLPPLLEDERIDRVNEDLLLIQKKQGLTYGTDAFLLAAYLHKSPYSRALELGAGTGIVSLLAAKAGKFAHVTAVELQPVFADLIGRNASCNRLTHKVRELCADIRELKPDAVGGEVDLVFANPPYMKADTGRANASDEKYIARHETAGSIYDFCQAAARCLRHGGHFVSVFRPDRMADLVDALRSNRLEPKRMTLVYADSLSEPCMVLTDAAKGGAPSMRHSPPLILYRPREAADSSRILTPEAQQIYDTCDFSGFFPNK